MAIALATAATVVAIVTLGLAVGRGTDDRDPTPNPPPTPEQVPGPAPSDPDPGAGARAPLPPAEVVTPPADGPPPSPTTDLPERTAPAITADELRTLIDDVTSGDPDRLRDALAWEVTAEELDAAAADLIAPDGSTVVPLRSPSAGPDETRLVVVAARGVPGSTTVWQVARGADGRWRIVDTAP